jgi:hypothetical protein
MLLEVRHWAGAWRGCRASGTVGRLRRAGNATTRSGADAVGGPTLGGRVARTVCLMNNPGSTSIRRDPWAFT